MRRPYILVLLAIIAVIFFYVPVCSSQNYYNYYDGQIPDEAYTGELEYKWGLHLWIWQYDQRAEVILDGRIILTSRIVSGLAGGRFKTPEGDYHIQSKGSWWHNNHQGIEMPLPMYFKGRYAIHGWSRSEPFPDEDTASLVASHGCISVEKIQQLYEMVPVGTPVHVRGHRTGYK